MSTLRLSRRLASLPEFMTAELARLATEERARGRRVIALGIGDPDLPPSPEHRRILAEHVVEDDVSRYPTNAGSEELRVAIAAFYQRRFGVALDPERQILPLLGAKEGIAHLCLAALDPGEIMLVPDPGYPVYASGPRLAGADSYGLELAARNDYLPDFSGIPAAVLRRSRLLVVGYPNNPTGAVAHTDTFERLVDFARRTGVIVCHDNAYSELTFDGFVAPSFLAADGACEVGVEVFSMSKAFSLPGWRVAFMVGNAQVIAGLRHLKGHVDAGMFLALQRATAKILDSYDAQRSPFASVYERRRDLVHEALSVAGAEISRSKGGMFMWCRAPAGIGGDAFAKELLRSAGVLVVPGRALGKFSSDFVRISLAVKDETLAEGVSAIAATVRHLLS